MADKDLKKEILEGVAELLEPIHDQLGELSEKVESNTGSLMRIEQELGAYREAYQVGKERDEKLDQRVRKVEEKLGLSS